MERWADSGSVWVGETGPGDRLYAVEEQEESRMAPGFQREQCGQMCPHSWGSWTEQAVTCQVKFEMLVR